jgi:predicted nucleic acid-binding protein
MSFLVDADVLCEATRPQANPQVLAWLTRHDVELQVSVVTLGEILRGIRLLPRSRRRQRLEKWFSEVEASFEDRIIPIDVALMRTWAELYSRHQCAGRLPASFDSLLAATASHHKLTVVTRNVQDFPEDIRLVDPWTP